MKIGYLDCFAGCAGDMFLGALLDGGVPLAVFADATSALGIDASLRVERVDRSGISATKVHVLEGGRLAEAAPPVQEQGVNTALMSQPRQQHRHRGGHGVEEFADQPISVTEAEGEEAAHGRSLKEILRLISEAELAVEVKAMAAETFRLLGVSEAKIHNVPVEEIHFHEVGAVDAIVDIVATCAGVHWLGVERWVCSPVNVGSGMVRCAHGVFPVPAPATADLLRGMPTYAAHLKKELVTPTGAALLRMLAPTFGEQPAMRVDTIGYGAGTRNPPDFPNVLRLSVGQSADEVRPEQVTVLETALDDLSPQVLAYVAERLLAEGALDVMLGAVVMKKGRPGTLVTVLCEAGAAEKLTALLLRETSTLGVRRRVEERTCLERAHVAVETPYGTVRIKVGSEGGTLRNAAPEFEDCRRAAEAYGAPLKVVQQAAMQAFAAR